MSSFLRFRFRLRTMLIATTLLAVVLGFVGNVLIHIRRQTAIAAKIKEAGGSYYFNNIYNGISDIELERDRWNRESFGEHTFRRIRHVQLFDVPPRNEVLALLPHLPRLEALQISADQHTPENLRHIAQCRRLQTLVMHQKGPESVSISELRGLTNLRWLELNGFDEARLRDVATFPQLETITLRSRHTNPAVLDKLQQLPKLRVLEISHCVDFEHQTCAALVGLDRLEILGLGDIPLNAHDFKQLAKLPSLRYFAASEQTELDLESATILGQMSNLERLNLGKSCTDETLAAFAGLPKLEFLFIRGSKITDASVPALKRFPKLKHLDISGAAITVAGLEELGKHEAIQYIQTDLPLTSEQEITIRRISGRDISISR